MLVWNPSISTNVAGYNIYYGVASGVYNNTTSVVGPTTTNATVTDLVPGTTYYFAATAVDSFGVESPFSNETSYSVPSAPPTLDALANVAVNENAGQQTVALGGISGGAGNGAQSLTVSAVSGNPGLIANPAVNYTSPNATGSLSFTPVSGASGTALITVTVNNGGMSNNVVTRSFTVNVNAVNQAPTLDALANVAVNENAGQQTVALGGISGGAGNGAQSLTVSAVSGNPGLIANPAVNYTSPSATGTISFTPVSGASGTALITVTVNNGRMSNNVVTRSFTVNVNAVNQAPTLDALANVAVNENAGQQTVALGGISGGAGNGAQSLTVSAVSGNPGLIANPAVSYTSPSATGTISFTPVSGASGTALITVTVNNGGMSNNVVTRSFTVNVNAVNQAPTLDALANVAVNENAGQQTVALGGIGGGAGNGAQSLTVSAVSGNPGLIANPAVNYTSPSATGTISFTPVSGASGTALITVTVNNGRMSNNVVTQSFTVNVNAVNQAPTLDALANVAVNENAGQQTVALGGISGGAGNGAQSLTVSAVSGNPGLIANPAVSYTSPSATGTISFTPVSGASGTALITVTVNNGGMSNNVVTQSFTVNVNAVNQAPTLDALANVAVNENAGQQTVALGGISGGAGNGAQSLTVSAVSGNPGLIANPAVNYTSPNATGSLSFTPVSGASGTALITVTVNNGGMSNNVVTRSFTVNVNAVNQAPTLDALANVAVNENAGQQTVALGGISGGAGNGAQSLTVSAVSGNPGLIANPAVNYTSPSATGTISFTPVSGASGTALITVTVNNGRMSNNVVTRSFTVNVNAVNQAPTLDALANVAVNENAGQQTVALGGISGGAGNGAQSLTVTPVSNNPGLIMITAVSYTSPSATGTISFTPVSGASGTALITVTVNNGGMSNNKFTQSFTVTVNPLNQAPTLDALANVAVNENAGQQTVALGGISGGAGNGAQTLDGDACIEQSGIDNDYGGELHESQRDGNDQFYAGVRRLGDGADHGDGQQRGDEQQ